MVCIHCGGDFDLNSPAKKSAGGKINECEDCSEETHIPYLGVQSADAKAAGVTILSFGNNQDRDNFASYWRNNSGMNKGKSCQLGTHLSVTPNAPFKKVYEAGLGMNHKGKMN
jgi:hypothetical protein